MSKKKKLIDITQYCFLSGEPIIRLKDLTKEHYCPKSKLPPSIANDPADCCRTQIPACKATGSPSLPELQLLPGNIQKEGY